MKRILIIFLCVILLFCSVGCGNKNNLIKNADLSNSNYSLGDYMGDYTVTDVNGNSYTFSELLKTKKAIVLNFWFINCGPCQFEFPFLQEASDTYSESVAVIAINTAVEDNQIDIQQYAQKNNLTIPLVKGDVVWNSAFNIYGFPTTVVIDRYGCVAFSHTGYITEKGVFEKIFEFFSSNNYKQTTIKNISDIK